ncbi:MAG: tRNA (adenosine(37)-N6)-threonylcarbamoyltransferase complex transferase subunit TsaD [Candidatus Pacebacteria bacterium]|nr:tRNA (adenosine(37)-N6)-threonylcarbamoyltransferase complex transferase subunit TsaD [Candidatus Paceibacterota bacterium]
MKILSIETSCDETAVAILEATGNRESAQFTILGNALYSQIDVHREFGGVFPAVAKREHAKNLTPLLRAALVEANMCTGGPTLNVEKKVGALLDREHDLKEQLVEFLSEITVPDIDAIAVTRGPGLEPALWVGVNFAQALSLVWEKPLVPIDHMEGHLLASLVKGDARSFSISNLQFPVLALLVSGGHTELILMGAWHSYALVGRTRDDAVGEAFDKVARMLGLPYPGGPEISKLAHPMRTAPSTVKLPRPMLSSPDFDFSFSGLKTAVMYLIKGRELTDADKCEVAREFEDAAVEVLYVKTAKALEENEAKTLAVGGGVSANRHLKMHFSEHLSKEHPEVQVYFPPEGFTGDNAVMIGIAGFYRAQEGQFMEAGTLRADGNLALER